MPQTVSAVVVSFDDPIQTRRAVESLVAQSAPPQEILVVDNHPAGLTAAVLGDWQLGTRVRVLHTGRNLGYPAACNRAAAEAGGEWMLFMNPDATADPKCVQEMLAAADDRTGVLGAQVLLPDGRTNSGDNPLHVTGLSWSGRFGEPREDGMPRRVAAVSGAALMARADAYRQLGGMCEPFFLYHEDADLCWRMGVAGWKVVFCPAAVVWHEYEFDKGPWKWYRLERNRLWSVLSNYSLESLLLLAPMLVAAELAVTAHALRAGWARELARAWGSTLLALPQLRRWRGRVQASRRAKDSELAELMRGRFETGLLDSSPARLMNPLMESYRWAMIAVLRATGA